MNIRLPAPRRSLPSRLLPALLVAGLLAACGGRDDAPAALVQGTASSALQPAGPGPRWDGRWYGPEGTYLEIASEGDDYQLTLRDLDGPRSFRGTRSGSGIAFERDGTRESIRPGSGPDTGMKWLADKSNCLVVKPGEGYCRG